MAMCDTSSICAHTHTHTIFRDDITVEIAGKKCDNNECDPCHLNETATMGEWRIKKKIRLIVGVDVEFIFYLQSVARLLKHHNWPTESHLLFRHYKTTLMLFPIQCMRDYSRENQVKEKNEDRVENFVNYIKWSRIKKWNFREKKKKILLNQSIFFALLLLLWTKYFNLTVNVRNKPQGTSSYVIDVI